MCLATHLLRDGCGQLRQPPHRLCQTLAKSCRQTNALLAGEGVWPNSLRPKSSLALFHWRRDRLIGGSFTAALLVALTKGTGTSSAWRELHDQRQLASELSSKSAERSCLLAYVTESDRVRIKEDAGVAYLRHLGQGVAAARAEQRIRGATAKGRAHARFFFGQLDQHQQNQQQTVPPPTRRVNNPMISS